MEEKLLCEELQRAAREAGKIMLKADHIRSRTEHKEGHGNFVTVYDKRVQEYLFRELARLLPEANFIGEENGADRVSEAGRRGYAFCVDPIDGTANFVAGFRPSATSIGLLRDGRPYIGVVYNPYWDMMFTAIRGQGAYLNGTPIHSSQEPLENSMVCFGTAPYNPELSQRTFRLCAEYLPQCIDLRRDGVASLDLCHVAMGTAGLYFELHVCLWDYAAAALIAEEAGCRLTDMDGGELPYCDSIETSILCASSGVAREAYLPKA